MPEPLRYDPAAARRLIDETALGELEGPLSAARDETFDDVELMRSGSVPAEKTPLDAGFIPLPGDLLAEHRRDPAGSLMGRIDESAGSLRGAIDRFLVLGIGGSYMGARALFEALRNPYHNELGREERGGIPRLYFEGNNLDNDAQRALLDLLEEQCTEPSRLEHRWAITVISKSGGTLETAVAFRLFRGALERFYGAGSEESRACVVPVTGETGRLRDFSGEKKYPHVFPIPDGVGGRYSVFTAVGLLPAAVLGIDLEALLEGAAEMTDRCRTEPPESNPVLQYVAACHLLERDRGMNVRVLSAWSKQLEALGLWYDQLLAESLGKGERGATPITAVNTRDLHSRGQQHQEGPRDKLITNVVVESPSSEALALPPVPEQENQDGLNRFAGKTTPEFLSAALRGTNKAYAEDGRPTADIVLPRLDAHAMGQLMQMLMLATAVEGRLIGINPYGQPGVEAYKRNMNEILSGS